MYGVREHLAATVNKGTYATIKRWFLRHPDKCFHDLVFWAEKNSRNIYEWVLSDSHLALLCVWMDYKGILPFESEEDRRHNEDLILECYPKYYQMDWEKMLPVGALDDPVMKDPRDCRPVPCMCTDTGKEYRSFTQAAKDIGVNSMKIRDCCYGEREQVKGYHFQLIEPSAEVSESFGTHFKKLSRAEARAAVRGKDTQNDRRPVPCICTDIGKEYRSFTQAAKDIGANSRQVADCCYGVRDKINGHHFCLKEKEKSK